ncbi:MAG: hypothetical protein ABIH39_05970, partial [Candidatus Margulisiibacteriota bacterium]
MPNKIIITRYDPNAVWNKAVHHAGRTSIRTMGDLLYLYNFVQFFSSLKSAPNMRGKSIKYPDNCLRDVREWLNAPLKQLAHNTDLIIEMKKYANAVLMAPHNFKYNQESFAGFIKELLCFINIRKNRQYGNSQLLVKNMGERKIDIIQALKTKYSEQIAVFEAAHYNKDCLPYCFINENDLPENFLFYTVLADYNFAQAHETYYYVESCVSNKRNLIICLELSEVFPRPVTSGLITPDNIENIETDKKIDFILI